VLKYEMVSADNDVGPIGRVQLVDTSVKYVNFEQGRYSTSLLNQNCVLFCMSNHQSLFMNTGFSYKYAIPVFNTISLSLSSLVFILLLNGTSH
jgi:hypothetical protein